ncbi:MAG: zinc ribbon domain-containing protein [Verrucomicrobiota bacterium]|jgi:hypothetical protein
MKSCGYCGRENEDEAAWCRECGTKFVPPAPRAEAAAPPPWERITTLENEIEADRLDLALRSMMIPHVMVSYSDSAFDGLFQAGRGWGHVESPKEHREVILSILNDLRQRG